MNREYIVLIFVLIDVDGFVVCVSFLGNFVYFVIGEGEIVF